jgi:predicted HNH restriction endonuclease
MRNYDLVLLVRESDKCDVLCANCHKIHHYGKLTTKQSVTV